jgi:hypothetical protein
VREPLGEAAESRVPIFEDFDETLRRVRVRVGVLVALEEEVLVRPDVDEVLDLVPPAVAERRVVASVCSVVLLDS